MRLLLTIPVGAALLAAAAVEARADTLQVGPGRTHETIASAVAAAQPGDRIVVNRGTYVEDVTLDKADVTISGRGGVVWYGTSKFSAALTIAPMAERAAVSGITFRGHRDGIRIEGPDATVSRCLFRVSGGGVELVATGAGAKLLRLKVYGCSDAVSGQADRVTIDRIDVSFVDSDCVYVDGDDVVVTNSSFRGSADDYAIDVQGHRARIQRNRGRSLWNSLVHVRGDDALVEDNDASGIVSDNGYYVQGHGATVRGNRAALCASDGIQVQGDDAVIEGNVIDTVGDDGIDVRGTRFRIAGNRVSEAVDPSAGIYASTSGTMETPEGLIEGNVVTGSGYDGIEVNGAGVTLRRNQVSDCGRSGFVLYGTGHVLELNTVTGCGDSGYLVLAAGTSLSKCVSKGVGDNAFLVVAANVTLTACTGTGAAGEGLESNAANVTFTDCTFLGNRLDVGASQDMGDSLIDGGGNKFKTGGTTTPPVDPNGG